MREIDAQTEKITELPPHGNTSPTTYTWWAPQMNGGEYVLETRRHLISKTNLQICFYWHTIHEFL